MAADYGTKSIRRSLPASAWRLRVISINKQKLKIMKTIYQIIIFSLAGCFAGNAAKNKIPESNVMRVARTQSSINVDGKLDEPVWKKAQIYKLGPAANRARGGKKISQSGEVQLAWDKNYFYVEITFNDLDIIAEGKENQLKHYKFGNTDLSANSCCAI
jgi:hypothetical protein